MLVTQLCPILCNPMDCSLSGSSVQGVLQVRTLEWVAISFSRESSQPGDEPRSHWATREAHRFLQFTFKYLVYLEYIILSLRRSTGEETGYSLQYSWALLIAQLVKNPPAMKETWVWSLGWEDLLEKGKTTHFRILAWIIPRTV